MLLIQLDTAVYLGFVRDYNSRWGHQILACRFEVLE